MALGYSLAAAAVLLAMLLRLAAAPLLGAETPFIFLFPAVLVTAWYAGRGPALAAVVFGAIAMYVMYPPDPFDPGDIARAYWGRLVIFVMVSVAMTELTMAMRRAELRGVRALERLDLALASGQMGVWEWDLGTNEVWWSDSLEPVHGLPRGAFGRTFDAFRQLIHSDDRERVDAVLAQAIAEHGPYDTEFRFLRPDGSVRVMSAIGRVYCGPDGKPARVVGTSRDITDAANESNARKEAEAALIDADRRKDEFLAILAHELRNPLAPVRLAVEMLRSCDGDKAIEARALDVMSRQLAHLVRLIDDLLDVSRITRGKLELRRGRVTLQDVLRTALETSRPMIDAAKHTLSVAIPEQPLLLHADTTRLAQVVSNLLNNAAKYTPKGGQISLTAQRRGDEIAVIVSDNGIGLAKDNLARVFDMFAQVDPLTTRTHGGLGIGLALARALVDMHGGRLEASSEGEGKGSTFTLLLPIAEPTAMGEETPVPQPVATTSLRVLVADDNIDAIETLAIFLQQVGHTVQTANDGVEALEVARAFRPDVCVLDIGMPRMDGYEVARKLRERHGELVLIALTGWGQAEDHRKSREAGFDYHLIKPVQPSTLVKLLATASRAA